ncbi:MAG: hypothetical protein H0X13_03450 [Ramlibacter sp.]|nr:hypothetical protein [Ramlibacter sp.]
MYLALRRKLGRTNNGDINATLAEISTRAYPAVHPVARAASPGGGGLHRESDGAFSDLTIEHVPVSPVRSSKRTREHQTWLQAA